MKIAMFGVKGVPVPAGAENVAEQVGSRLVKRGFQVTIYVRSHYTPTELQNYRGMKLVHLPSIPTKNLEAITHGLLSTLEVLLSDADIVHIHATGNSVYALLPRIFGKKTVVQSHGLDWQRAKWGWLARLYLRLTDYSTVYFPNATTAVSQKLTRYYQTLTDREIFYIPNGITTAESLEPNLIRSYGLEGNDYVLFASRFVPEKGAHYLIEAFNRINTTKKLVMAGDGILGDPYARKLKTKVSDRIIFPGFVQGRLLQELFSNAYLYVLPSEIEGLSTGLLEAMSFGNCVLVSDIEENIEVISEAGVTFRSKCVGDLEDKLRMLIDDEKMAMKYRTLAKLHVLSTYDWEITTDEFVKLYYSLLDST